MLAQITTKPKHNSLFSLRLTGSSEMDRLRHVYQMNQLRSFYTVKSPTLHHIRHFPMSQNQHTCRVALTSLTAAPYFYHLYTKYGGAGHCWGVPAAGVPPPTESPSPTHTCGTPCNFCDCFNVAFRASDNCG